MIQFNGHLLASIDVESTGLDFMYHDMVQLCILPLEPLTLDPHPKYRPFYQNIRPRNPERADPMAMNVHKIPMEKLLLCPTMEQVEDALFDWSQSLELGVGKRVIPLIHNSPFDIPMIKASIGCESYDALFARAGRDTMFMANGINDRAGFLGFALPFKSVGLKALCDHFGIDLSGHHDALEDCLATAKVYKELLRMEMME